MDLSTKPSRGMALLYLLLSVVPAASALRAEEQASERVIVRRVDGKEHRLMPSLSARIEARVTHAAIGADGAGATLVGTNKRIYHWRFDKPFSLECFPVLGFPNESHISDVELSEDGRWLASASPFMPIHGGRANVWTGGLIRVWDRNLDGLRGSEVFRFVNQDFLKCIRISRDRRWIAFLDERGNFGRLDMTGDRHVIATPAAVIAAVAPGSQPPQDVWATSSVGIGADCSWAYRLDGLRDGNDRISFYDMSNASFTSLTLREAAEAEADILPIDKHRVSRVMASCVGPNDREVLLQPAGALSDLYQLDLEPRRLRKRLFTGISTPIRRFATLKSPSFLLIATDRTVQVFDMERGGLMLDHELDAETSLVAAGLTASNVVILISEDTPDSKQSSIKPLDRLVAITFPLR
jgi:hypothetical protein